ncbi:MAG: DUF6504 family protein [Marmoricola sp.]
MRRYDDPVEVRRGEQEGPDQFLWRGRLWQVREVAAHWMETGPWWICRESVAGVDAGPGASLGEGLAEREVWRVTAARGMAERGYGVFDLAFDWASGDWRLAGAVD